MVHGPPWTGSAVNPVHWSAHSSTMAAEFLTCGRWFSSGEGQLLSTGIRRLWGSVIRQLTGGSRRVRGGERRATREQQQGRWASRLRVSRGGRLSHTAARGMLAVSTCGAVNDELRAN